MAQKRITSFFSSAPAKKPAVDVATVKEDEPQADSPVKTTRQRSKRLVSSSESESELSPKKHEETENSPETSETLLRTTDKMKTETNEETKATLVQASKSRKLPLSDSEEEEPNNGLKSKRALRSRKSPLSDSEEEEHKNESDSEDMIKRKKTPKRKKKDMSSSESENGECDSSPKQSKAKKKKKSSEEETKSPSPKKNKVHSFFNIGSKNNGTKTNGDSAATKESKTQSSEDLEASYNPAKSNYHPIDDACWKHGDRVPYLALAKTLEHIEDTSARLEMIRILANYLRSVLALTPEDFLPSVYLCLNQLAPAYEGMELGVADFTLVKVIAQTTGRSTDKIKADVKAKGDLGIVAETSRSSQKMMFRPGKLMLRVVFDRLKEIAQLKGNDSVQKKMGKIQSLLVACRHAEARYLIRSLTGKLRIGLAELSVLSAIGQACYLTPPGQTYPPSILNAGKSLSAEALKAKIEEEIFILKTTYCECPSYDKIVPVLLKEGIRSLPDHCCITPGIPMKPMLAQPTKGVQEVLTRFDNITFTCEWKYDGERAQIHLLDDGTIHIFSRNQENNTSKYPDIISRFTGCLKEGVKSCILDSEAVAWDAEKKQILPFQVLSTRKRKDANAAEIKVQVCVFAFDLLYLNGKSLVQEPLSKRRTLLHESFTETEGELVFARSNDSGKLEDIQEFLEEAVKGNCEGLMVKTLDKEATYEIAKRSRNWLKLKKDYLDGVGDTLDVVVLGGYLGKGKRTGTYGGFLLACYDPENEEFQSICKIGTGFSDEALLKHSEFFKEHVISKPKPYFRFDTNLEPEHWFEPVQVWEIKCADLSISPIHKAAAGIVDPEKGISLRFPRFLRIRDDKKPEDATSARQVADMYSNQDQVKNQNGSGKTFNEEDFY